MKIFCNALLLLAFATSIEVESRLLKGGKVGKSDVSSSKSPKSTKQPKSTKTDSSTKSPKAGGKSGKAGKAGKSATTTVAPTGGGGATTSSPTTSPTTSSPTTPPTTSSPTTAAPTSSPTSSPTASPTVPMCADGATALQVELLGSDDPNGTPTSLVSFDINAVNSDLTLVSGGYCGQPGLSASFVYGYYAPATQPNPEILCLAFDNDPCFNINVIIQGGYTGFEATVLSGPAKGTVFEYTAADVAGSAVGLGTFGPFDFSGASCTAL